MNYKRLRALLDGAGRGKSFDAFTFLAELSTFASLAPDEDQLQLARDLLIRMMPARP